MKRRVEFKKSVKAQIEYHREDIRSNKRLLKLLKYIPNLDEFPGKLGAWFDEQIHFDTPWDNPTLEKIKVKILNEGWRCTMDDHVPANGWRRIVFRKKIKPLIKFFRKKKTHRLSLYVYGKVKMEGSTCQRVKIGEREEMATFPIYEIVCDEGAEEVATARAF